MLQIVCAIAEALWFNFLSIISYLIPSSFFKKAITEDDVVLITGAGSGIGRGLSLAFAENGAKKFVLWDVDLKGMEGTRSLLLAKFPAIRVRTDVVDVTNRETVYSIAKAVKGELGPVSYLVNNAGIVTGKKLQDLPDDLIVKTMEVNTHSHFWTLKAFLPDMKKMDRGHVVTIASLAGLFGSPRLIDYHASKFAAVGIHKALEAELYIEKSKVNVTCICPFYINTGMFDGVVTGLFPMLEPDEVVQATMNGILVNQSMVLIPGLFNLFVFLGSFLSNKSAIILCHKMAGLYDCMNNFKGRKGKNN